jgi:hypothetical protein
VTDFLIALVNAVVFLGVAGAGIWFFLGVPL